MVLEQPWSCGRLGGTAVSVSASYARGAGVGRVVAGLVFDGTGGCGMIPGRRLGRA